MGLRLCFTQLGCQSVLSFGEVPWIRRYRGPVLPLDRYPRDRHLSGLKWALTAGVADVAS